jgi:acyl carrier protein
MNPMEIDPVTQAEVADRIEHYIRNQFRVAPGDIRFSRSVPLFEAGYVDSVGVVELLAFLSKEFAADLPDDVLMSDEFSTIDGIAAITCRYGAGSSLERETETTREVGMVHRLGRRVRKIF